VSQFEILGRLTWAHKPTTLLYMVRRIVGLVFALALTAVGGYLFVFLVFFAHEPVKIMFILGAAMMLFLGLYWLWADYIHADPKAEG
jgi:hypothetical protein